MLHLFINILGAQRLKLGGVGLKQPVRDTPRGLVRRVGTCLGRAARTAIGIVGRSRPAGPGMTCRPGAAERSGCSTARSQPLGGDRMFCRAGPARGTRAAHCVAGAGRGGIGRYCLLRRGLPYVRRGHGLLRTLSLRPGARLRRHVIRIRRLGQGFAVLYIGLSCRRGGRCSGSAEICVGRSRMRD